MLLYQFEFLKSMSDFFVGTFPVLIESKSRSKFFFRRLQILLMAIAWAVFFVFYSFGTAKANLQLCNDTRSLVSVSLGYREKGEWVTEGWWRIPSDKCSSLTQGELTSRFFYVYAEDAYHKSEWRGDVFMCTDNREFRIEGIKECYVHGYQKTGFFEVDTSDKSSWMIHLNETGQTESVK